MRYLSHIGRVGLGGDTRGHVAIDARGAPRSGQQSERGERKDEEVEEGVEALRAAGTDGRRQSHTQQSYEI